MAKDVDLEGLRALFADSRQHIAAGKITKLGMATDRSALRVQVSIYPEEREIVAQMTWDAVGAESGFFQLPAVGEVVIVGFLDGDPDDAFILGRLAGKNHKIPQGAADGHLTAVARPGKKAHVQSDTRINLSKTATDPTEPLVLGLVAKEFLTNIIDQFLNAAQIGFSPFGPVFLDPGIRTALVQYKATYLTNASTNILSQLAFTERGT